MLLQRHRVAKLTTFDTPETQDMCDILAGCPFRDWAGFRIAKPVS
jgi:muconolactone delta-isomerase